MKNITSKLIALGLTGALAVVSFTACSKAKETTAGTTAETAVEMVKGDNKVGGWSYAEDPAVDEHVKAVVPAPQYVVCTTSNKYCRTFICYFDN